MSVVIVAPNNNNAANTHNNNQTVPANVNQDLSPQPPKPKICLNGFADHVNATLIKEILEPNSITKKTDSKCTRFLSNIEQRMKRDQYHGVKMLLRKTAWPIDSPVRRKLWPMLCAEHPAKCCVPSGFYWEMVEHIFGTTDIQESTILLPAFVDNVQCIPYFLTSKGSLIADRIVNVLVYDYPGITYSPSLYPITALLLHYMSEEEAYYCVTALIGSRDKVFINQNKLLHEAIGFTLFKIVRRYSNHVIIFFRRNCPDAQLERIFSDWCWWILSGLPFSYLVRIMDCFLHEGIKVLYRVAIAILNLFQKKWETCNDLDQDLIKHDISNAIFLFCKKIPVSPAHLLHSAFNLWGLSEKYISKIYLNSVKAVRNKKKTESIIELPVKHKQFNILTMPHTLIMRDRVHTQTWQRMLFTLWSWLPGNIGMQQPVTIYSTQNNERSLNAFYKYLGQHEPTLMIIETCNNEIFGAYCSSRWLECRDKEGRRYIYFGTGETFLFTLYPKRAKYSWVDVENIRNVGYTIPSQFLGQTDDSDEGKAIWLDDTLEFGRTSKSKSFNSPALCPMGEFKIRLLQIYGFIDPNITTHKYNESIAIA